MKSKVKFRQFWQSTFCILLLAMTTPGLANDQVQPNIILIMADDLGFECIGVNGGTSYQTPNLDRLAKSGIRFNHCYAQPLCTPSRVKIMTGLYNVRNYEKFGLLPESQVTFANYLKTNGYSTCVVGKWQLGGTPRQFGFDEYCLWHINRRAERYPNPGVEINGKRVDYTNGEYGPDVVSDYACNFIEENKDRPFLVYYPMILTHCPFCPTPDSSDWDPENKGSKTYKGNAKYFGDMVSYMDKIVAKIERQLESSGVRDRTLIMFTGDNGTDKPVVSMMGDRRVAGGKGQMTDAGTRVPLIANWPGVIPAGQVSNDLIDFSDFLPTMAEATSTKLPSNVSFDGRSFLPQLSGKRGNPRDWIYCWYSRGGGPQGKQWTRNQRYKLYPNGKFFDVQNDVLEKKPLVNSELTAAQRKTKTMLQRALDQYAGVRPASVAAAGDQPKKKNN